MCFSASASFTVGAALVVPALYAIKQTESRGMLAFACTPIVFCFHQIAEGFLWLSLKNPDFASWYKPGTLWLLLHLSTYLAHLDSTCYVVDGNG